MPAAGRFCNERTYYEAGLRRRGSLTLWIEDTALQRWQTCGPGGQSHYADAAIQTSLMLRTAFKLPLRQTDVSPR
jgi:Transposase DDE domain